jgi:hypothetical protein
MNDEFFTEFDKVQKLERLVKADILKRNEQENSNIPTSIVT